MMRSMQAPGKMVAGAVVLDGEDVLALPGKEFDIKVR